MDSYVKSISVDVNAEENYTMVKAKQGDKINRKLAITLKKDGANFTPSGVSEIWFRVEKPDSNIVIVKSTDSGSPISVSGNVYTVDLTEQCLTASGEAWCDIAFLDSDGNTLSSAAFVMKIIPMPNGDSARSSSAWTDLQNAIDNIETIVQEQLQPAIDDAERFASILAFRVNNGYIQYSVDSETWINLMPSSSVGSPDSDTVPNRSDVSGETVSQALNWLKNNSGATSDDITNESTVTGQTVTDALDNLKTDKAPLDSPEFTGTPTSTTPASTDNSTKIATTAFIKALLSALSSNNIGDDSDADGATVKASLNNLKGSIDALKSADISDDSNAGGVTVKESLNNLIGSLNDLEDITGNGTLSGFTATDLTGAANELKTAIENDVLYFSATDSTAVSCSATTGDFGVKSDSRITADHIVAECVFANPSAITTDVTWTTAAGSLTLNGTCTSATTASVVLVKR